MELPVNPTVYMVCASALPQVLEAFASAVWQLDAQTGLVISYAEAASLTDDLEELFDSVVLVEDIQSAQEIAASVRNATEDVSSVVLVSWFDSKTVVAARAAEILGHTRTPAAGIARARNKLSMRRALASTGRPSLAYSLMSDAAQAEEVAAAVGLPAILKPLNGTASALISRVESVSELREAYERAVDAAPAAANGILLPPLHDPDGSSLDPTTQFLVEAVLRGPEYDAEIVVVDGVVHPTLLMQIIVDPVTHYIIGMASPPLDLLADRRCLILSEVQRAVDVLGLDNTTANVTVIDDVELGPTLVEMNAGRFGGSMIPTLVWTLAGVDLRLQNLEVALGLTPRLGDQADPEDGPVAAVTVLAETAGTVVEIRGLDALRAHPKVVDVAPHVTPGDVVAPYHATYAVNAVVSGFGTLEDLVVLQQEFTEIVEVVVDPECR